MSTLLFESVASGPLWIVVKATALLLAAAFAQRTLFRRSSAASRHAVWTLALLAVVVLPGVALVAPQRPLVVYRTAAAPPAPAAVMAGAWTAPDSVVLNETVRPVAAYSADLSSTTARAAGTKRLLPALGVIYLSGLAVLLFRWLVERWKLARFAGHAVAVDDPAWMQLLAECMRLVGVSRPVRLLRSRARNVPMAFGTRRPAIVIPSIADTWSDDRRKAVLLHELSHVVRCDSLTHMAASTACALYWFHPMVWWTARRMRVERELACDDRVIRAGTTARDYAEHLLEIAYSLGGHPAPALAVCMARPRQLEGRMLAALDRARNRAIPGVRVRFASIGTAAIIVVALAVAHPVKGAMTPVSEPPAAQDRQWPDVKERPALVPNPRLTKKELKDITRLPLDALQAARSRISGIAAMVGLNQDQQPGTWEIRPADSKDNVHLRIVELHSSSGTDVPITQLEGLTPAQLTGNGGPVQFRVRRDAGTFTFEGVIHNGVGAGTFSFTPDPNFPAELVKRGFARPTSLEQYQMARHDVGFAFIDELNRQGYAKAQTPDLVRAGQHGVQASYLREMGTLGYRLGTLDQLITLRDHGITPAYVRGLADQGYKGISADDLREARDHGIVPEYVQGMRDAGYSSLPMADLIRVRDHGITPEFARALAGSGYSKLPLEQLVRVRDHGVSPEYVGELKKLGFTMSVEDVVRTRDHGITVEFVRTLASLGYGGESIDALIRVRDHGVTEQYVKDVKALGYDKVTLDDLVSLRDHGLTIERIRSVNQRAGTRLPIDMLQSMR